ncbi:hypothetical protein [Chroococcidiopsis sp.]
MASFHQPVWALPIEAVYESLATASDGLPEYEAVRLSGGVMVTR